MMELDAGICGDRDAALRREWLETNGLGGFASSTIAGANTRRYHGLLVAAIRPPVDRVVMLAKLDETLLVGDASAELGCNLYPGAVHPEGYKHLRAFRLDPLPTFVYEADGVTLLKRIFMVQGRNLTVITYRLTDADGPVTLRLRPLVACRGYHTLGRQSDAFDERLRPAPDGVGLEPYGPDTAVYLTCAGAHFEAAPEWFYSLQYPREIDRGLDFEEDLFSPGHFTATLSPGESVSVLASSPEPAELNVARAEAEERERREKLIARFASTGAEIPRLVLSADQFLVQRNGRQLRSVIAGYHWFTDWGRDTMIALPGLTVALGCPDEARRVLQAFAKHCSAGMIPNRFPDEGEQPDYNTVDASLWFIRAAAEHIERTGDHGFLRRELFDVLWEIVDRYSNGTRFGIRMGNDCLITAGEPGLQLTWMDAKVGDDVITPRDGKCVEINALWFSALKDMEQLAPLAGRDRMARDYAELAEAVREAFGEAFWNPERDCLHDRIEGTEPDPTIRPNQIFAVSLPHELLPLERQHAVVQTVHRELYTPYGLRSLAPGDPQYIGRYGGDQRARDGAYHQGTVWAWLMGPFIGAWLKVNRRTPQAKIEARQMLQPLLDHLQDGGLGTVSEIFDGDAPHEPKGCISQAWSVAELLRVLLVELA